MQLHIKLEISGKVQGVMYRRSAKEKADQLGIVGYIENCDNGTVYVEAEGEIDSLETFIKWCHEGPERSIVKEVVVLQYQELKHFQEFDIHRSAFY